MVISRQMMDREYGKFREASGGGVAVAVVNPDGSPIAGGAGGSTSTTTQVGDSTTVVTLKAANSSLIKLVVVNTSSAVLYVKEGSTATASDWSYRLEQYDTAIIDDYDGIVTGLWSADSGGDCKVTETS